MALQLPHIAPDEMTDVHHLLFALKHEGVEASVIDAYLGKVPRGEIELALSTRLQEQPTSKYVRILWFLYEWLTGRKLPVDDLKPINYVPVLGASFYYTGEGRRVTRQRVIDNLLGDQRFCPFVRKTDELTRRSVEPLEREIRQVLEKYDPDLLHRAATYLYTKETLSSFAIERETPSSSRLERFMAVLQNTGNVSDLDEPALTRLQAAIVDPRFAQAGFRRAQNYVGESIGLRYQTVHFIPPRPSDLPDLMKGWRWVSQALSTSSVVDPVVAAAVVAFSFVYLHPFQDGNGRIHRLLIHHVLGRRRVTPNDFIVPVSAVMLARRAEYDEVLESFSKPLLELIDRELDEDGSLTVTNETARHYRYLDLTEHATALYRWLESAVSDELVRELDFLVGLRSAKREIADIVDLPDRLGDLLVKCLLQNGGKLSKTKREGHFDMLTDDEVSKIEEIVARQLPNRVSLD